MKCGHAVYTLQRARVRYVAPLIQLSNPTGESQGGDWFRQDAEKRKLRFVVGQEAT